MNGQEDMRLLTIEEVAAVFRQDPETVEKLVTNGMLPAIDLGGDAGYRILFNDLKKFIEQRKEQAEQAAVLSQQKAELEQKGLCGLCNWLKGEKRELANLYRELSSAMDKTAHYLYEELNSAHRSGDHSKARGIQESLAIIQERWEKPRNSYSTWVFQSQERWEKALGGTIKELAGDLPTLVSPWQADLIGNLLGEERPENMALPLKHRHIEAERKLYREMSQWFQQEIRFLHECYRELDRTVEKTVKTLKSKAKKASKDLDFGRSQVLTQAMTNLYHEWERARSSYNHWLEGQEERWQHFKKELPRGL
ncbi:MAG: helix-turn-helix domain-containing protein [Clostridia bacterium]|nr:helix-turn-helix domain-containing protein [Clostridia bacterium]